MRLPLAHMVVAVTRARHQADALADGLRTLGAEVILAPLIEIAQPQDFAPLDRAINDMASFEWIVFTSANAVHAVFDRMAGGNVPVVARSATRVAAIGPATADALTERFRPPDLVPSTFVSSEIVRVLPDVRGASVLLPRADKAHSSLPDALRKAGARVVEVEAYRILRREGALDLPAKPPDYVLLFSSETVRSAESVFKAHGRGDWMRKSHLICVGPKTAETVRELGLTPTGIARNATVDGVIAAVVEHAALGAPCGR